jgi:hypothetical protein
MRNALCEYYRLTGQPMPALPEMPALERTTTELRKITLPVDSHGNGVSKEVAPPANVGVERQGLATPEPSRVGPNVTLSLAEYVERHDRLPVAFEEMPDPNDKDAYLRWYYARPGGYSGD